MLSLLYGKLILQWLIFRFSFQTSPEQRGFLSQLMYASVPVILL